MCPQSQSCSGSTGREAPKESSVSSRPFSSYVSQFAVSLDTKTSSQVAPNSIVNAEPPFTPVKSRPKPCFTCATIVLQKLRYIASQLRIVVLSFSIANRPMAGIRRNQTVCRFKVIGIPSLPNQCSLRPFWPAFTRAYLGIPLQIVRLSVFRKVLRRGWLHRQQAARIKHVASAWQSPVPNPPDAVKGRKASPSMRSVRPRN